METNRKFSDVHPSLYTFMVVALSMLFVAVATNILRVIGGIIVMASRGSVTRDGFNNLGLMENVLTLVSYVIALAVYYLVFRKNLSSSFFHAHKTGKGILLCWSVLLIDAFTLFSALISGRESGNVGVALLLGITPGVTEEILCRIIPLSFAMKSPEREKRVQPAVVFTSLIFGLGHIINIFSGADIVTTLFQVLYATGTGFLFGTVYIRTGNMWITIILHSLTDFIFFLGKDSQLSGGVLSESTGASSAVFLLVFALLYFVNAFIVFRKETPESPSAIWERVWKEEDWS